MPSNFSQVELDIIKALQENKGGYQLTELVEKTGKSRQLLHHHLNNGLNGIIEMKEEEGRKIWILQPAFYELENLAQYLLPFILKAQESYNGEEDNFEKFISLLLGLMILEL